MLKLHPHRPAFRQGNIQYVPTSELLIPIVQLPKAIEEFESESEEDAEKSEATESSWGLGGWGRRRRRKKRSSDDNINDSFGSPLAAGFSHEFVYIPGLSPPQVDEL